MACKVDGCYYFHSEYPFCMHTPCEIMIRGIKYKSVTHYLMVRKAEVLEKSDVASDILKGNNFGEWQYFYFNHISQKDARWDEVFEDELYLANVAKFTQDDSNKEDLLDLCPHPAKFVYADPFDPNLGIGIGIRAAFQGEQWNGKNLLGEVLTRVRDEIVAAEG